MTQHHRLVDLGITIVILLGIASLPAVSIAKGHPCDEPKLSQKEQQLLDQYLIVYGPHTLILSSRLVPSCETRQMLSLWLTNHLGTPLRPTSEELREDKFASRHRALLNRVVLKVWPLIAESPAVPNDGALADDKWAILEDPLIEDSVVDKFVSDDLSRGGLWREDAYLLFSRSLPHAFQLVRPILDNPKARLDAKLYAFALLSDAKQGEPLPSLDMLIKGETLSGGQEQTVEVFKARRSAGQVIEWSDFSGLIGDDI
ncbi:MAG: hypothetical protein ABR990_14595 [Terracidiphilus sp.]|jgi:hypothetical protein